MTMFVISFGCDCSRNATETHDARISIMRTILRAASFLQGPSNTFSSAFMHFAVQRNKSVACVSPISRKFIDVIAYCRNAEIVTGAVRETGRAAYCRQGKARLDFEKSSLVPPRCSRNHEFLIPQIPLTRCGIAEWRKAALAKARSSLL